MGMDAEEKEKVLSAMLSHVKGNHDSEIKWNKVKSMICEASDIRTNYLNSFSRLRKETICSFTAFPFQVSTATFWKRI